MSTLRRRTVNFRIQRSVALGCRLATGMAMVMHELQLLRVLLLMKSESIPRVL
jgi:hypothetical protein